MNDKKQNWKDRFRPCLDIYMEKLEPILVKLDRGDSLSYEVIEQVTGQRWQRLEGRIRRYFNRQAKTVYRRDGALHVCSDGQEWERAVRRGEHIRTQAGKNIILIGGIDQDNLTVEQRNHVPIALARMSEVHECAGSMLRLARRAALTAMQPTKALER